MRLDETHQQIQEQAASAVIVPSTMRGIPRRRLALSPRRLRALLAGRDLEVSLERTLISLKAADKSMVWFNQFNVAGGVGGGNGFNRAAVDLGRFSVLGGKLRVEPKELKAWTSNDSPREAVEELFAYCCWLLALHRRGVSPYEHEVWKKLDGIRLHLIAPEPYFTRHRGVATACSVLRQAEAELAALRSVHPELSGVTLAPVPIVLPGRLGPVAFVRCFDPDAANRLVAAGKSAASALEVLHPEAVPTLGEWFHEALVQAGAA
jgi:hypothetical protein